ncbi:MAG: ATP-binding cassette domain-containing protein [Alphaproteobacteria bacterium]|nr:ATP-binding cassette domain-containing protein [Alphaproteobacteria bacterium]
MPVLKVEGVVKSYGRTRALDGASLDLRIGEFVVLLGPNGAGKSTLFQLLTGLFVPDEGSISIMGHDMRRAPVPALAHLGIVFQQSTLDPELTVSANLWFHTRLQGMDSKRAATRIAEELARVELTARANDRVRTLSGGNKRRVELARALLHDPSILLMDEPTVGLDAARRRDMLNNVLRLRQERRVGILWSTHLVDEAQLADRIVVLHHGKVLRNTTPTGLIKETGTKTLSDAFLKMTADTNGLDEV